MLVALVVLRLYLNAIDWLWEWARIWTYYYDFFFLVSNLFVLIPGLNVKFVGIKHETSK